MLKMRAAAGDRVLLPQVDTPLALAACFEPDDFPVQEPQAAQPRRKDGDTTQTIAFGSR
jgi:hypothetical protein